MAHELEATLYEVLTGTFAAAQATIKKNYDVIPADIRLSGAELELSSQPGREMILKEALQPIQANYDYILIDCPPSLGLITLNGLTAAQEIIYTIARPNF